MKTIGLIATCFYPRLPRWLPMFIESCGWNPSVRFFLITNLDEAEIHPPPNMTVVRLAPGEFGRIASEKTGIDLPPLHTKKVLDFKPAYCTIFEDYIEDLDFCGYCDTDLVFGNIRAFMTDEVLSNYDVISALEAFPSGHFTLFRRGHFRLYERSRDYRRVFTSSDLFSFSECGFGLHYSLFKGAKFADVADTAKVDSLMHVLARSPDIRVHYRTICDEYLPRVHGARNVHQRVLWDHGSMRDLESARPLMYYHLQTLKSHPLFYLPPWQDLAPTFVIGRNGARSLIPRGLPRMSNAANQLHQMVALSWSLMRGRIPT